MKQYRNWSLKYKFTIPIVIVMFFLYVGITIITHYSLQASFEHNTEQIIDSKIKEINTSILQISNDALYIASLVSEMELVKQSYKNYYQTNDMEQSSQMLHSYFSTINDKIYSRSGHKARIHFHLPPAISFCRCWSDIRGDDISDFRNTVLAVSKNHSFSKGIETGRGGFVIRGLAPIFSKNGEYYGSVEAFFNINHLISEVNNNTSEEFAIFMHTDLLKIATNFLEDTATNIQLSKKTIGNYILVDKTKNFNFKNLFNNKDISLNEKTTIEIGDYIYATIPINNMTDEVEGIGILQIDISSSNALIKNIGAYSLILAFLLIVIVIFFIIRFADSRIINRIKQASFSLDILAKGEMISKLPIETNDEIGEMQSSINKLNNAIKKNSDFATEIGSGRLSTNYQAISNEDILGNAMLLMQEKLITYRQEKQEALEITLLEQKKFKTLSNLTFEGILIHKDGVVIDANQSLLNIFGYHIDEIKGKNVIEIFAPKKHHDTIKKNIIKKYAKPYEVEGIRRDGSIFPLEIEARDIFTEDDHENRVTAVRDITYRKKIENEITKLSNAVEQSANSIVITDTEGNIEYCNAKFTELTGYSLKEVIGKNPRILNSQYHPENFYAKMWRTITTGGIWKGEIRNKTKDGKLFWEQNTISSIKDNKGNIIHYLAIKEDVTERNKLIEDLIRAKEKAVESDRLKSAFLANMSHEIRTPLNSILGFSRLLKEPDIDAEEIQEYSTIIERGGERLLNTINDLMDISKIEAGQTSISISEFNIRKHLQSVLSDFKIEADNKGLILEINSENISTTHTIRTDYDKFYAIFSNLVKNAIKYTNEGIIEFGYQPENKEKKIIFYVKDTGIGIPNDRIEVIFDRFIQADMSISSLYEGVGLGLSIVKAYVKLLGGKVWVESEEGKGSVFYFTIQSKNK